MFIVIVGAILVFYTGFMANVVIAQMIDIMTGYNRIYIIIIYIVEIDRLKYQVLERKSQNESLRYIFEIIFCLLNREVFGSDHFNFSFLIPTTVDLVDSDEVRGYRDSSNDDLI